MTDTNKNYRPFIFSKEDRKKILFQELLSATIICFAVLAISIIVGVKENLVIGVNAGGSILFGAILFLVHKYYKLAIGLYLTLSLVFVYLMIFFFPNIKFAALFILVISLNGFIYLNNYKTAILFLKVGFSIGILTLIIQIFNSYRYYELAQLNSSTWYDDNIVLLIFLGIFFAKIFFLFQNYNRILKFFIDSSQKSEENFKNIFKNNSLAIAICDISARYELLQKLKTEQNVTDIKAYLDENDDVFLELLKSIRIKEINDKGYELRGAKDKSITFGNKRNIDTASLKKAVYNEIVALFEDKPEFSTELDLVNHQGIYKRLKYFVKYPENKDFSNVSYTYIDITDQQKTRLELNASNERYRTLYDNAPVGIIILDIDKLKRGLDCNKMLLNILKVDKHTALNGNMIVLSPEYQPDGTATKDKLGTIMSEFRMHRKPIQFEWLFKNTDNAPVWTEVTFSSLKWEGEMQSIMFIKDVTKQKRQQQVILKQLSALNQKKEELEKYIASNLELENFAYIASHDLQAPLRTVISFSNLLERSLEGKASEAQKEYMNFIVDGTYHMRQLINDLLEFSRINTTKINLEVLRIQDTVELVLLDMREHIENKSATITCSNIHFDIKADKTKLRQLIQNLVNNALKFTVEVKNQR